MNPTNHRAHDAVRVWDAPTRVFHWLLALSFALAYASGEEERWLVLHVTMGYTVAALVAWRLLWGLIGTRHARFADFVRGPVAWARYARSLLRGAPEHFRGHNPLGGAVIVTMLLLGALVPLSGWSALYGLPSPGVAHALEEVHEALANAFIALVVVHVAGVIVSGWLHRDNLVRAMLTGIKPVPRADATHSTHSTRVVQAWTLLGWLMLVAVLSFWGWRWSQRAELGPELQARVEQAEAGHEEDRKGGSHKDDDD